MYNKHHTGTGKKGAANVRKAARGVPNAASKVGIKGTGSSPTKKYSVCGIFASGKHSNAFSDYVDLSLKQN